MLRIISIILVVCLVLPFAPAKAFAQETSTSADYFVGDAIVESQYKLGPGDQLGVNLIVGDNALSLDYQFIIGPDGKIFFPNVGEISLLGLTIPEAKKIVNEKVKGVYREKYNFSLRLTEPRKIQLYVTGSDDKPLYMGEQRYVYIYGEVAKSGRFTYVPGKKFSDYISYAGGPTARANLGGSTITRENSKIGVNGSDVIFNGDISKDVEILAGDVISIPGNFFYFTDFASFANTILLALTLYSAVAR